MDAESAAQRVTDELIARWKLAADGPPIVTPGSRLLPVRRGSERAILKVASAADEQAGGALMAWWDGVGAARVLEHEGGALLMERAEGARSLSALAREGRDDEATHILCDTIAALHKSRGTPSPALVPLTKWFEDLTSTDLPKERLVALAAEAARVLLSDQSDDCVLHGDIHHGNVLDFGERGWLAIDPKGLSGDRGFDYANLFRNPDMADASIRVAADTTRFRRRLDIVAERAGYERPRLLLWILALCGLSATWISADGGTPAVDVAIAALAVAELGAS